MARQSFGRTVRYRRTKLGLSQTRLAELVGRSPGTIRSWEAERSIPRDPAVLTTLAAILGVDEALLFERAGVERPAGPALETTPTLEQALASISPDGTAEVETSPTVEEVAASFEEEWREQAAGDDGEEPPPPPRRLHAVPRPAPPRPIPEPTTPATMTPVSCGRRPTSKTPIMAVLSSQDTGLDRGPCGPGHRHDVGGGQWSRSLGRWTTCSLFVSENPPARRARARL